MEQHKKVFDQLEQLGIPFEIVHHPAVFTIEEMEELGIDKKGEIAKNLFLRDDRGKNHYLVVVKKDKKVDLKELRNRLNSSRLGFASEERLYKYLQLTKGSVTPLGVINDEERAVNVVIDKDFVGISKIGVHPNNNTATIFMSFDDLIKVIKEHGNPIIYTEI